MAENKRGFVLYADLIHMVDDMTDKEAGQLFKHLLAYVNDRNPQPPNKLIKLTFEPVKQQLKRDLAKYKTTIEKRSLAGKASAEKRKQQNEHVLTYVESVKHTSTHSTVIDTDNVTVNDSVTDNVISKDIYLKWETEKLFGEIAFAQQKTCKLFSISEINNGRSFIEVGTYLLKIHSAGKLDYYLKQLTNYFELKKQTQQNVCNIGTWLHGGKHILEEGHWCRFDYDLKQQSNANTKPTKRNPTERFHIGESATTDRPLGT